MSGYDLLVLGAGSGGVRAARLASQLYQVKVGVIESNSFGGTCVNLGCIPKKLFAYSSKLPKDLKKSSFYGWDFSIGSLDWYKLTSNVGIEINRLNKIYNSLLTNSSVDIYKGFAKVISPHLVEVNGKQLSAKNILIATGSKAYVPNLPGIEHAITSDDFFNLHDQPQDVVIVGGGYIAVELACILKGLGSKKVKLVYRGEQILKSFDQETIQHLQAELLNIGIEIVLNTNIISIKKEPNKTLKLSTDKDTNILCDEVLYATGRIPNTSCIDSKVVDIQLSKSGAIMVDDYYQTSVPSIWAVGDVIDKVQLTPVAIREAMCLLKTLFEKTPTSLDYSYVPTTIFTSPEVATVGLSEEQANKKYPNIKVFRSHFRSLKDTLTDSKEKVFMKIIVNKDNDRVLGMHIMSPDAGEILQGFATAIQMGVTKSQLDSTIGIHPTLAEELVTMK